MGSRNTNYYKIKQILKIYCIVQGTNLNIYININIYIYDKTKGKYINIERIIYKYIENLYINIQRIESLCCTSETNVVNQLYFNFKKWTWCRNFKDKCKGHKPAVAAQYTTVSFLTSFSDHYTVCSYKKFFQGIQAIFQTTVQMLHRICYSLAINWTLW